MSLSSLINPEFIVTTLGTLGVIVIIFLETGAFFGFFFPGDSLLFTAGFFAAQGYLNISALLVGTFVAAVLGDNVGYGFGKRIGPAIFKKDDSIFFSKKNVLRAKAYFDKYGKKTIILARFIPIVRTFAPILAGVGGMNYKTFFSYNIIGGLIWTWGNLALGYGLSSIFPNADKYMFFIVLGIIFVSVLPAFYEIWKNRRHGKSSDDIVVDPKDLNFK